MIPRSYNLFWMGLATTAFLHGRLAGVEESPRDLVVPAAEKAMPAPGKRVRQFLKGYEGTDVYHLLYLPTDWTEGKKYPVIVEYAGNRWKTSPGNVEGCELGYGVSGGEGVIWICMPFVDKENSCNALNWWGDVEATVDYCKRTVGTVCDEYGGDRDKVYIAGFSRGAIACNFIGLHDDEIAALWRGFICHSHYDGVRNWGYAGSDRKFARERLKRLGDRPQFISHESSVDETKDYLGEVYPDGNFTFLALQSPEHTSNWVLSENPERRALRRWFRSTLEKGDVHAGTDIPPASKQ